MISAPTALGLGHVLDLGVADAELHGRIAVRVLGAMRHDLAPLHLQDGDGHVFAGVGEHPRHAQLLCDNT